MVLRKKLLLRVRVKPPEDDFSENIFANILVVVIILLLPQHVPEAAEAGGPRVDASSGGPPRRDF